MHEVDLLGPPKSNSWEDIKAWRKQQRDGLIKARPQDPDERRRRSEPILDRLSAELRAAPVLGIYWPFRGEIDVRELAHRHIELGGVVALPVVVEKNAPVQFWRW